MGLGPRFAPTPTRPRSGVPYRRRLCSGTHRGHVAPPDTVCQSGFSPNSRVQQLWLAATGAVLCRNPRNSTGGGLGVTPRPHSGGGGGPTTPPPLPYFQGCRFLRQKFILTASPPKLFSFARCCGSTPHHEFLFTCEGGGGTSKKTGSRQGLDAKSKRAQDTGAEEGGDAIRRMIAAQSEVPFRTGACRLARSPPFWALVAGCVFLATWSCSFFGLLLVAPPHSSSHLPQQPRGLTGSGNLERRCTFFAPWVQFMQNSS